MGDTVKIRLRHLPLILGCFLLLTAGGIASFLTFGPAYASSSVQIVGAEEGLEVEPEDGKVFDIENLYPGKETTTEVEVRNQGEEDFDLTVRAERDDGSPELFQAFEIKVAREERSREIEEEENEVELGTIESEEESTLEFTVGLPEDPENRLQNKYLNIDWIFAAAGETIDEDDVEPEDPEVEPEEPLEGGVVAPEVDPGDPLEEVEVEPEEPEVEPGEPEIKPEDPEVEPDEPWMSLFGELPPYIYYLLGAALLLGGVLLGRNRASGRK